MVWKENYIGKNDTRLLSEDTVFKTNKISEIYGKLTKYEKDTKNINKIKSG